MARSEFRVYAGPNSPNSLYAPRAPGKEPAAPEDSHTRLKAELQTTHQIKMATVLHVHTLILASGQQGGAEGAGHLRFG